MRIAQIHNKYRDPGGEDIVVQREFSMLRNAGHEVFQFFVSNETLDSQIKKTKIALNMIYNNGSKEEVIVFLKTYRPDVVHVHNFLPILSPSIFDACKEHNIPVVLTLHNFRLLCINGLLYRGQGLCTKCISKTFSYPGIAHGCYQGSSLISVFPALSNAVHSKRNTWQEKIDKVIFLSEFSKEVFDRSHLKFLASQEVIKPHFVEDRGYNFMKEDYFLFVGRLSEEKGINTVLEAFKQTNYNLIVAGEGPLKKELQKTYSDSPNIEFIGFQNQIKLQALYMNARALITASKMYESFGLVIIEAFSYGTPVIAPDFGNAGELVQEGYNGLKYILGDAQSLKKNIKLITSKECEKLNENARKTFLKKYTEKTNQILLENIYEEILSRCYPI